MFLRNFEFFNKHCVDNVVMTGKEYECHETARNLPPPEILELAEDIYRLPVEFQKIIIGNVEDYKALCFKLEKENTQSIG